MEAAQRRKRTWDGGAGGRVERGLQEKVGGWGFSPGGLKAELEAVVFSVRRLLAVKQPNYVPVGTLTWIGGHPNPEWGGALPRDAGA